MRKVIVKLGGSTLEDKSIINQLAQDASAIPSGTALAVVHGGGREIKSELSLKGIESEFVQGQRVTDKDTMKCVVKALSGSVNKEIVSVFRSEGVNACGISGVDGGLIKTEKLLVDNQDIGFVGKISEIDTTIIETLFSKNFLPVIAPVSSNEKGDLFNVNADNAAGAVAEAVNADDLIFISDIPGVLIKNCVRSVIKTGEAESLISEGHIKGGMIPKLRSSVNAVNKGVKRVHICDWKGQGSLIERLKKAPESGSIICRG